MAFVNAEDRYGMLEIVIFPNVYEKYSALLGAGGALLFRGTVNLKENEEPKIICDSIASARTNEDLPNRWYREVRCLPAWPRWVAYRHPVRVTE